ncbi:MAG: OB-fold nucleic acid binding domain-containing protein, partial [Deltaproteobacteria bacterium]
RFGLGAVKGIGEKAIELITAARGQGDFSSIGDFVLRISDSQVNRRTLEGLIKSGAFDRLEPSRARLLAGVDSLAAWATRVRDDRDAGQMGLFSDGAQDSEKEPELPDVADWDTATRLEAEHEVVGFYITGHPLDRYTTDLKLVGATATADLADKGDQSKVVLVGVTNTIRRKNSRKGDRYATFNLEDGDGSIEVIAWPKVYATCEATIISRQPVFVSGTLEMGEAPAATSIDSDPASEPDFARKPQVIANEIIPLVEARRRRARSIDIKLEAGRFDPAHLDQLKDTLAKYPGQCRPYLKVIRPGQSEAIIELPEDLSVDPSDRLLAEIEALAGPGTAVVR